MINFITFSSKRFCKINLKWFRTHTVEVNTGTGSKIFVQSQEKVNPKK